MKTESSRALTFSLRESDNGVLIAAADSINLGLVSSRRDVSIFEIFYEGVGYVREMVTCGETNALITPINNEAHSAANNVVAYKSDKPFEDEGLTIFREQYWVREGRVYYDVSLPPRAQDDADFVSVQLMPTYNLTEQTLVYCAMIWARQELDFSTRG